MPGWDREVTLRFLAAPTDVGYSGSVDGGRVLEWIDKAGYALAAAWSGRYCVTAYVGNVQFSRPVGSGSSRRGDRPHRPHRAEQHAHRGPGAFRPPARRRPGRDDACLVIFVAVDDDGRSVEVPAWRPLRRTTERAEASAVRRIDAARRHRGCHGGPAYTDAGRHPAPCSASSPRPPTSTGAARCTAGSSCAGSTRPPTSSPRDGPPTPQRRRLLRRIRFYRPLRIGDLVEVEARLLHTGTTSMHISVHVRSGDPRPTELEMTTHCLIVFVPLTPDGRSAPVRPWHPVSSEDRALDAHALELVRLRSAVDLPAAPTS